MPRNTNKHLGPTKGGERGDAGLGTVALIRNVLGLAKDTWHATYPTSFSGLPFMVCNDNMTWLSLSMQALTQRM